MSGRINTALRAEIVIEPKRITEAVAPAWIGTEYATVCPFSAGNKWLVLQHSDGFFHLYTGAGEYVRRLPINHSTEPRWIDPDHLVFRSGSELRVLAVGNNSVVTLRRFTHFADISGKGESDISKEDRKHLVLCGDGQTIFAYDIQADKVSAFQKWPRPFNALYITPDLNVLVCEAGGVFLLERGTMRQIRKVAPTLAHNDVCRDTSGDEILVRINANDQAAELIDGCANGIEKVRLADGKAICLWPIDWNPEGGPQSLAAHISSTDLGFSLVSTYSPMNMEPGGIYKVQHDGSGAELLCRHGSIMMPDGDHLAYSPQPKASVSGDGSRFVFCSNGGDTSRGPHYCDTFLGIISAYPTPTPPVDTNPPIVVQPEPVPVPPLTGSTALTVELALARQVVLDLRQKLAATEKELWNAREEASTLRGVISQMDLRADEAQARMGAMDTDLAEAQRVIAMLHDELKAAAFERVDFSGQTGRRWLFEVLRSLRLRMFDAFAGGTLSPITTWREGDEYLFRAVRDGDGIEAFEMLQKIGNR